MSKMKELMKSINKELKGNIVSKGLPQYDYKRIPFTSPRLNYMTYGGIPMGKLVEFFGENHGGKTTTALDVIANYQHMEGAKDVVYADMENTFDRVWATKLGVDVENLWIIKPEGQGAETVFEQILQMLDTGEVGLVVIDSYGAMMSNKEFEDSVEDNQYGGIAKALTKFSKKAEMLCNKYEATVIGINQLRAKMNDPYGGMTTTGGEGWKFLCSARFEFRMGKYIDAKGNDLTRQAENPAGNYVMVTMKKNKTCPPTRRTGFYTLNYLKGINYLKDLIEVALKYGIIEQSGAWFAIKDAETGEQIEKLQGQARVYEYLESEEHIDTLKMIEQYIDSKIQED
jgi:recombination protein RecA